ncbi:MAG: glycosyltransferase family 4 protein [Conexivisphaerales archaeon]
MRIVVIGYPSKIKSGGDVFSKRIFDELDQLTPLKKIYGKYYPSNPIRYWSGALMESIQALLAFPQIIILQGTIEAQILTSAFMPLAKRIMIVHHLEKRSSLHSEYQGFIWREYIRALERADLIITVSESSKGELLKETRANREKIKVIRPGLDTFKLPSVKKDIDFLIMGRAGKFLRLAEIIQEIKREKGDATICMIGPVNPKCPLLNYLGFVNEEEKLNLMARAKVVLHPSAHEGYSLTLAESIMAGLPVVAWALPVFKELYANAEGVKLIENDDILAFAEMAIKLLGHQGEAKFPTRTWREAALEVYDILTQLGH